MQILFLTTQLPYPPVSGGAIKSWRLVEHWYKNANIRIVCPLKGSDNENLAEFKSKLPGIEVYSKRLDRSRSAINLALSYLTFAPTLNTYRNYHSDLQSKISEWCADSDVIIVDHYEMGQYLPMVSNAKVVLHEHNAEYVMWDRMGDIEKNPLKKFILKLESSRIRRAELSFARRADRVWAAPNDIEELVKIGVDRTKCKTTYHLGDDFMLDLPDIEFNETDLSLLFIGTLTWEANIDGLLWFFENIWPTLAAKIQELHFYVVGKNPDKRLIDQCKDYKHVHFTGFVENLEPYYRKGRVFVIPLRFGSGIKVKLLNAMYRGIPAVTTPIGVEGLEIIHGKELYCTVDPATHIEAILTLLQHSDNWISMRNASRKRAQNYSYKELLKIHDKDLKELVSDTTVD